jgi:hypothetical protein
VGGAEGEGEEVTKEQSQYPSLGQAGRHWR